jgi:hypothetical protein
MRLPGLTPPPDPSRGCPGVFHQIFSNHPGKGCVYSSKPAIGGLEHENELA